MRILSFNIQNLRLRQRGDQPRLDGARDRDDIGEASELDPADRRLSAALLAEAQRQAEEAAALRARIGDPVPAGALDEEQLETLRALGYVK